MDFKGDLGEIEDFQKFEFTVFLPNLLSKFASWKDIDSFKFINLWKTN